MLRCLIVDDSPTFLMAAQAHLERQGAVVLGVAQTSEEAVRLVGSLRPDVTLVDLHLGDESGLDLARRLVREVGVPPTQVILMSTLAREDFEDLATAAPAAGFVSKSELSLVEIRRLMASATE